MKRKANMRLTKNEWKFVKHLSDKFDEFTIIEDYTGFTIGEMFKVTDPDGFDKKMEEHFANE